MIAEARRRNPDIEFREGDAEQLAFGNGLFEAAVMNFGILHLAGRIRRSRKRAVCCVRAAALGSPYGLNRRRRWVLESFWRDCKARQSERSIAGRPAVFSLQRAWRMHPILTRRGLPIA